MDAQFNLHHNSTIHPEYNPKEEPDLQKTEEVEPELYKIYVQKTSKQFADFKEGRSYHKKLAENGAKDPKIFSDLGKLDLDNLELTEIPKELRWDIFDNLYHLNLIGNKLSDLPESLTTIKFLYVLALQDNQFKEIPSVIFKLKKLNQLELATNPIRELPERLKGIIRSTPIGSYWVKS